MTDPTAASGDGEVLDPARLVDIHAIEDLASSYAYAVDDRDWVRWEALFLPDALIDYTSAGGISGNPAELAAWMPDAMAIFDCCMHSASTHEIRFTGPDEAVGRVHVFNRNTLQWEGNDEVLDVGAVYEDIYRRVGNQWRFSQRVEDTKFLVGGGFAEMLRGVAADAATEATGE